MPNWKKVIVSGSSASQLNFGGTGFVSASAISSPSQGNLTVNGSNIDLGLQTSDAPSFTGLILTAAATSTTSTRVFVSGSGGVVQTRVFNTDLLDGYDIVTILIPVDHRGVPDGFSPLSVVADLQPAQSPYGTWIAPYAGHIHAIQLMVGQPNTSTNDYYIQPYKNGNTLGAGVTQALSSTQYAVYDFAFGGSYSFSRGDLIEFEVNKFTNTCDLYTIMITYKIQPFT